jgi:hypothetical protein
MSQTAIGIDEGTNFLYEGSPSLYGHAIWPTPFLSIASHIGLLSDWSFSNNIGDLRNAKLIFREDFFDPVARVRRGRLYTRSDGINPSDWHVQPHPANAGRAQSNIRSPNQSFGPDVYGYIQNRLTTFRSWLATDAFLKNRRNSVLVLGFSDRIVSHAILDVERLANGEELITIRTRASLGVLPELLEESIPKAHLSLVMEQYEKAANAAFRDGAESVVDRCREAASSALIAERSCHIDADAKDLRVDLGELATFFTIGKFSDKNARVILCNAARIIARLHARTKSTERASGVVAITEGDAETALALLGTIYRELRWTR